jgi:hypothetical protein
VSAVQPRLSVIVPATNRPVTLDRCLAAIAAAVEGTDEVIAVVDPAGAGPAQARNLGARRASGDILVFVDADVVVHPDALAEIRAAFAADASLGGLFGCYDDAPAAAGVVSRFRNLLHHHVHSAAAGPADTFWAGLGALRRDTFLASGGFDADRFRRPSVEDIELGMRLAARGVRVELSGDVLGTHLKRWGLAQMVRTDFCARGVPWVGLIVAARRSGTGSTTALNLGWRHRLSALVSLAGVTALMRRDPRGVAAATAALVGLNRSFYLLLLRRGGVRLALAGVALHALHHLVAVASVPAGVAVYLRDQFRDGRLGHGPRQRLDLEPTGEPRQG